MPKYKTHLAGGIVVFLLLLTILIKFTAFKSNTTIPLSILYLSACLLGSLFPDIDTKSKIQKWIYFPIFLIIIIAIFLKRWVFISFLSILAFIPIIVNHRRLTHSLWFVIIIPFSIPILIYHYNTNLTVPVFISYLFFMVGAISHLFLDFGPRRLFRFKFRRNFKKFRR